MPVAPLRTLPGPRHSIAAIARSCRWGRASRIVRPLADQSSRTVDDNGLLVHHLPDSRRIRVDAIGHKNAALVSVAGNKVDDYADDCLSGLGVNHLVGGLIRHLPFDAIAFGGKLASLPVRDQRCGMHCCTRLLLSRRWCLADPSPTPRG